MENMKSWQKISQTGIWLKEQWKKLAKLHELKKTNSLTDVPIIIGSGATAENINDLFSYSNGVIVSTSLKKGDAVDGEVNIKPHHQEIDSQKVREFMKAARRHLSGHFCYPFW